MNGTELLRKYREHRSEQAMAELVQRYASLVFSVARRRLNSDALAEDAAQTVFIRLASAPPDLPGDAALLGWLHRTTLHVSIDLWRAESRRTLRDQKAATMHTEVNVSSAPSDLAIDVDEALNELEAPDRATLLMRFFDGRKMRELGEALGITEDAAKMRVSRSLERLRERLAQRGIRTTVAVLSAFLAEQAIVAAPAALARAILHALPPASTHGVGAPGFARVTRSKMAAVIVAVAIPLIVVWRAAEKIESGLTTSRAQASAVSEKPDMTGVESQKKAVAAAEPDPRALLEGVIRARSRIISGTMEIEAAWEHNRSPTPETNVVQLRIVFDGSKRRFEQTGTEYQYVGIGEEGERSAKTMEEKKFTRAEGVRAGLLQPFESRHVSAYEGSALFLYWETDGKSAGATIDDPAKGSAEYLFDPRCFGLNTYVASSLQNELSLGCAEDFRMRGQEAVEGTPAWRIDVKCPNYTASYWLSVAQPERVLRREMNSEVTVCRYSPELPRDPLPIEVVTTRIHGQSSSISHMRRRATAYNIVVEPEFCTLSGLGMQIGTTVVDVRASRSLGYWTGSGLSENLPRTGEVNIEDSPKIADFLDRLEHEAETENGLQAAVWIIQNTPDGDEVEKAARVILDHHLQSTNLLALAERLENLRHRCAKPILRGLLANNPDPETRAVACLSLGLTFLEEANYGVDKVATQEARVYLSRVLNEFMKTKKGYARHHYAKRGLQEIEHFFIGHPAPELRATSVSDELINTVELRGRVLVLIFSSGYSEGYEHRQIFEKFSGQPVSFIGISCTRKLETVMAEMEKDKLPWPIVWDGNQGPIAQAWLIDHWTATFIIDRNGIIRARDMRGPDLEKAIQTAIGM